MNKTNLRTFDEFIDIEIQLDNNQSIEYFIDQGVYFIKNLFSEKECGEIISKTISYYKSLKDEYLESERKCNRILSINHNLANVIWERIKILNFPNDAIPIGFGTDGIWEASGVNECIRYIQYESPSIGFLPHRDASFIRDEDNRSIYTIIIYINEDFEGGHTQIYQPNMERVEPILVKDELKNGYQILLDFIPKIGSAIIFDHDTIHKGCPVIKGTKYIIRTDIIFTRTHIPENISYDWQNSENFINAINVLREAQNQEVDGNIEKASELYELGLSYRQLERIKKLKNTYLKIDK